VGFIFAVGLYGGRSLLQDVALSRERPKQRVLWKEGIQPNQDHDNDDESPSKTNI